MYTAQTNPFYRAGRSYDPRECGGGQISWGQYNAQAHYNAQGQYYQHQFSAQTQYSTPPPATPHPALAGASWHSQYQPSHTQYQPTNQYQQLTGNIARVQQPPLPPSLSLPPPPPPP